MIAILLTTALAAAAPAQTGSTLAQWSAQDAGTRRIALVGAVEGILLATSAVEGAAVPIDTECFNRQTPEVLDATLAAMAKTAPTRPLAQGLLSIEQCKRKAAAQ